MKDKKAGESGGRSTARKWVMTRVTEWKKAHLLEQANIAGLSLSEYMRRRFLGGMNLCPLLTTHLTRLEVIFLDFQGPLR